MENKNKANKKLKLKELLAVIFHTIELGKNIFYDLFDKKYTMEIYKKGPNDQFTSIDWTIQKIMENYLKFYFTEEIKIVGEEDTTNDLLNSEFFKVNENLNLNWDYVAIPEELQELDSDEVKIYIDPVDATGQLVKLSFSPCMILVGITVGNSPFIGVVNYPLFEDSKKSLSYFNIPSKGIFEFDVDQKSVRKINIPKNDKLELIITENMRKENDKICQKLSNWNTISLNGFGNKGLESIKKNSTFYFSKSCLGPWDTCALHAIARENTGGIFNMKGEELEYNEESDHKGFKFPVLVFPEQEKKEFFFSQIAN